MASDKKRKPPVQISLKHDSKRRKVSGYVGVINCTVIGPLAMYCQNSWDATPKPLATKTEVKEDLHRRFCELLFGFPDVLTEEECDKFRGQDEWKSKPDIVHEQVMKLFQSKLGAKQLLYHATAFEVSSDSFQDVAVKGFPLSDRKNATVSCLFGNM